MSNLTFPRRIAVSYTHLDVYKRQDKADGGDKGKTEQFMTQFLKNVEVFDTGGRGATTTFAERGLGDVLISFESEVNNIRKQYEAQGFEVVIPKTNILAEFPVAWVDKNVQANGTEKAAKAYLNWLYSPQAQTCLLYTSRCVEETVNIAVKRLTGDRLDDKSKQHIIDITVNMLAAGLIL